MDIDAIRAKVKAGKYIISFSHTEKIRLRKIEAEEIEEAICKPPHLYKGEGVYTPGLGLYPSGISCHSSPSLQTGLSGAG